ncbi:PREDICTED: olfactory receptor 51Q1-like, partial [Leptosomus discolor]|uniref:olfactory receptor 51Q1-like n=1 Tax=Leptosomus discolor TaxID=188344 RepID=UPI00052255E8
RYSSILTSARVAKVGLGMFCCSLMLIPLLCLLTQLRLCRSHRLSHSYCLHQDKIRLVCTDSTLNNLYSLTLVLFVIVDSVLITLSFPMVIQAVVGTTSREEQSKALSACVPHFCALFIFYGPMVSLSLVHEHGNHAAPFSHPPITTVYLFAPSLLNPVIQSMQSKPICKGLLRLLCQRLAWSWPAAQELLRSGKLAYMKCP